MLDSRIDLKEDPRNQIEVSMTIGTMALNSKDAKSVSERKAIRRLVAQFGFEGTFWELTRNFNEDHMVYTNRTQIIRRGTGAQ